MKFMDSVGQEFKYGTLRMAYLSFTVSEVLSGRTRMSEGTLVTGARVIWRLLHTHLVLERHGNLAQKGSSQSANIWPLCVAWVSSKHGIPGVVRLVTWRLRALRVNVVVNCPFIPSLGGHFHHILSVRAITDLSTVKGRESSSLMKRMSKHLKPCFTTATGSI